MFTIVASSTTMSWARPTVPKMSHGRGSWVASVPAVGTALVLVSLIALTYRGGELACAHRRANTAWMVRVLFIEAMPIWFQVRPKSARLIWTLASSHTSPGLANGTVAGNVTGLARPRTVSCPVTVTPSLDG